MALPTAIGAYAIPPLATNLLRGLAEDLRALRLHSGIIILSPPGLVKFLLLQSQPIFGQAAFQDVDNPMKPNPPSPKPIPQKRRIGHSICPSTKSRIGPGMTSQAYVRETGRPNRQLHSFRRNMHENANIFETNASPYYLGHVGPEIGSVQTNRSILR